MTNENVTNQLSEIERDNITLVKRWTQEVWNEKRIEIIDELLSPELIYHNEHGDILGRHRWKEEFYDLFIKAIRDLHVKNEELIANGDCVVSRWKAQGIHVGELFGVAPSGKKIEISGITWIRITHGKVVETWNNWDMSYFIQQLQFKEFNIALKVMMKQGEIDKKELEKTILFNINKLIEPSLKKLKKITSDNKQKMYLEVIEVNLNKIISSFAPGLSADFWKLTLAEIQIADFIRQGMTTKEIASFLNLSPSTIAAHRQNIRKKLNLTNKGENLQTALTTNLQ